MINLLLMHLAFYNKLHLVRAQLSFEAANGDCLLSVEADVAHHGSRDIDEVAKVPGLATVLLH